MSTIGPFIVDNSTPSQTYIDDGGKLVKYFFEKGDLKTLEPIVKTVFEKVAKTELGGENYPTQIKNDVQELFKSLLTGKNGVPKNVVHILSNSEFWNAVLYNQELKAALTQTLSGGKEAEKAASSGCKQLRLSVQTIIFICFFLISVVYPVILSSYIFSLGENSADINTNDKFLGMGCKESRDGFVGTCITVNGIITIMVLISIGLSFTGNKGKSTEKKVGFDYFRNLYVPEQFLRKENAKVLDTMTIMNIFVFLSMISNGLLYSWYLNYAKDKRAENPWYAATWSIMLLNVIFFLLWLYTIFYHYKVQKLGPAGTSTE